MGCRAHLYQFPVLGQVGHSPRGTSRSAGSLDWGPVWLGSLSSSHHLTNPEPDRFIFCHMAGWLANCSWQADCLLNKMSALPPRQRHLVALCDDCGHIDQIYHPPGRGILWPSVVLLWAGCPLVRCTPPHLPHETSGHVCIWPDVRSGQHHVRCTPTSTPPTEKVVWTWKDDWPPWTTSTPRKTFYPGG